MFKKLLIAAAIVIAGPGFVSAQDVFWSFSQTSINTISSGNANGSKSAYIFADGLFAFDNFDLDFSTSNSDVIRFTGGEAFDPAIPGSSTRFSPGVIIPIDFETNTGTYFAVNALGPGVGLFEDPLFDAGIGPNGAFLLARVDFDIVGDGVADLEFTLGSLGVSELLGPPLNPSFGSATLDTSLPIEDFIGDVNVDCEVNFLDIPAFIEVLVSGEFDAAADINSDGEVNFEDIEPFVFILGSQ